MDSTAASGMGAVKHVLAGAPSASAQRWSLLGRFISSRQPDDHLPYATSLPTHLAWRSQAGPMKQLHLPFGLCIEHKLSVYSQEIVGNHCSIALCHVDGFPFSEGLKAEKDLIKISRRPGGRFNVIQCSPVRPLEDSPTESCEQQTQSRREVVARYIVPSDPGVVLTLRQREDSGIDLSDFISSQKHDIDSTGLVCMWPAEEVMTYYCISRPELFRNKRVIELGSGYGLAGLAIAACTEASEVLLTDGNPQVVEYIRKNITENSSQFGDSKVRTCALHWSRHQAAMPGLNFDVVIAADCTFFKDFHVDLAHTIKGLLSTSDGCQALLFNPRRGDSLDRFVRACQSVGLGVEIQEQYDARIWDLHQGFARNEAGTEWPNYDEDHCYPLLLSVTHEQPGMAEAL